MAQAKISLTVGTVSFSGEGDEAWLSAQMEKVIDTATTIAVHAEETEETDGNDTAGEQEDSAGASRIALVNYIREKNGESNQVQRFLATADWLRKRGAANLTSSGVIKALAKNHQKRLANGADCLNKNVAKGYCEKTASGFFITPDGLKHLGSK